MKALVRLILLIVLAGGTSPVQAQEIRREVVHFAAGKSGATVKRTIRGDERVQYVLMANAGQKLVVKMLSSNGANAFNVSAPGATQAMFPGTGRGGPFTAKLTESGPYVIEVFLSRTAAQRGETARFKLDIRLSSGAPAALPATEAVAAPVEDLAPVAEPELPVAEPEVLVATATFWEVAGVARGDLLNLRAGPSMQDRILTKFPNGVLLRDKGCQVVEELNWCAVELADKPSIKGWVSGKFLRESAGPETASADAVTLGG